LSFLILVHIPFVTVLGLKAGSGINLSQFRLELELEDLKTAAAPSCVQPDDTKSLVFFFSATYFFSGFDQYGIQIIKPGSITINLPPSVHSPCLSGPNLANLQPWTK